MSAIIDRGMADNTGTPSNVASTRAPYIEPPGKYSANSNGDKRASPVANTSNSNAKPRLAEGGPINIDPTPNVKAAKNGPYNVPSSTLSSRRVHTSLIARGALPREVEGNTSTKL